jgi:Zn-dependent peptidase ImmA (M78 family)
MQAVRTPWASRLDELAADVLEQAGIAAPPVDALLVAERLKILVVFDATQQGRARHKKLGGSSSIFLKPDERPERLQWAAAHELGEVFAHRVAEQVDLDDPASGAREQIASQIASRLLLPRGWFFADAMLLDGDLFQLKKRYATASHELIAWRLLDLPQPSIVSIFDQGRLMRRRAQPCGQSPPLSPIERACWRQAHQSGEPMQQTVGSLRVQAWPVHEPHWKREILRTRPADED